MSKDYLYSEKSIAARSRSKRRRSGGIVSTSSVISVVQSSSAGSGSSVSTSSGHTHGNKDLLDSESSSNGYLLINGAKVQAGYADESGCLSSDSQSWMKILRKDIADTASEIITFAKGMLSNAMAIFRGGITVEGDANISGVTSTGSSSVTGNATVGGSTTLSGGATVIGGASIDELEVGNDLSVRGDATVAGDMRVINKILSKMAEIIGLTSTDITTTNLTVTGVAHFFKLVIDELASNKGAIIVSGANCKADVVISGSGCYDVYFRASDADGGAIVNSFRVGDQAICMSFNGLHAGLNNGVSNKCYWRLVTDVESDVSLPDDDGKLYHRIQLSNITTEFYPTSNCGVPESGDEIVQLGYRGNDDHCRESAIILSAYATPDGDISAPSLAFYRGINDFVLSSHRKTFFDATRNVLVGSLKVGDDEVDIQEYVGERTKYTHFAWAKNPSSSSPVLGRDWVKDSSGGVSWDYIGVCANTIPDSDILTIGDYEWNYVRGSRGYSGDDGVIYKLISDARVLTVLSDGRVSVDLRFHIVRASGLELDVLSSDQDVEYWSCELRYRRRLTDGTTSGWVTVDVSRDGSFSMTGTYETGNTIWNKDTLAGVDVELQIEGTVADRDTVHLIMLAGATLEVVNAGVSSYIQSHVQGTLEDLGLSDYATVKNNVSTIIQDMTGIKTRVNSVESGYDVLNGELSSTKTRVSAIEQTAAEIRLEVQETGSAVNYLCATDFVDSTDTGKHWNLWSSSTDVPDSIVISNNHALHGQNALSFNMRNYETSSSSYVLYALQHVKNSSLATLSVGQKMCLSCYVKRDTLGTNLVDFRLYVFGGIILSAGTDNDDVVATITNAGTSASEENYVKFDVQDTNWHRLWMVFTAIDNASIRVKLQPQRYSTLSDYSKAPIFYAAMPKLEVGTSPTPWVKDGESLRRAGVSITSEEIHLEGYTTVNKGFAIDQNGSMEANNGTFSGFVRTRPRVIQSSNLSSLLMNEDYVAQSIEDVNVISEYSGCLLPWHVTGQDCNSIDLTKSGAHMVFWDCTAFVHLPFFAPHPNSCYSGFDWAYYKGITGQTGPGVYNGSNDDNVLWATCCAEVLRVRSYIGCQVEIANMTGKSIYLCGLVSDGVSVNSYNPTSPWQEIILPSRGVLRATCVRVTQSASNITDLESVYWRVDSYAQIGRTYTAAALGITS